MKRLRPFFKYYGSKFNIAPKYPEPRHDTLVEPFAGSASYATLYADRAVHLVETDAEIAALWRWLIAASPGDVRALPVDVPVGVDIRELSIPYGGQLLIRAWQRVGRSNCWTISKWNNKPGLWTERARDTIASQLEAIRHWRVIDRSVFPHEQTAEATWFIDPPYQSQPTVYGNAALNYDSLAKWCQDLPGQAIVCEAPGANWLPFRHLADNTVGRTKQGGTRARRSELFWTSDLAPPPSFGQV